LTINANKGKVGRVNIYSNSKEANNLVIYIIYKVIFLKLFIRGHEFVYSASKIVYNCTLEPCLVINCFGVAIDGIYCSAANRCTIT
jgi:hypothetical protein